MSFNLLIKEPILFAIKALLANRLRTFLSLLGITIGIFVIVSILVVVESLERNVEKGISSLGDDVVYVSKLPWGFGGGATEWWKFRNNKSPGYSEFKLFKQRFTSAEAMGFEAKTFTTIEFENNNMSGVVLKGVNFGYSRIKSLNFSSGRFFSLTEEKSGNPVIIIGASIAENLFGESNPIGKQVKIKEGKLTVIGVLEKEGQNMAMGMEKMDNIILTPITYLVKRGNLRGMDRNILCKAGEGVELSFFKNRN